MENRVYTDEEYEKIYDKKILGEESIQDAIERIRNDGRKYVYGIKTIISGSVVESEIYPVYPDKKKSRKKKKKKSRKEQENLNDKNSQKHFVRMVNTNFVTGKDLYLSLSFDNKHLPKSEEAVKREFRNYIARLKRARKKLGLPPLKYIAIIEWVSAEDRKRSNNPRAHIHIFINDMDRDVAEQCWGKGWQNSKRLQEDQYGLEAIARYTVNHKNNQWSASKNLKQPKVFKNVTKLSKKKAEAMAKLPDALPDMFESLYKGNYKFNDSECYYSEYVGGFYLRARMKIRDVNEKPVKKTLAKELII